MKVGQYFKILDGDAIIGGIIVVPLPGQHHELGRIYLLPEYQNRGIGTRAMQFIEHTFPAATRWTLDTPCWAIRNHHFYEKLGYVQIGETSHYANDSPPVFHYEKRIPDAGSRGAR